MGLNTCGAFMLKILIPLFLILSSLSLSAFAKECPQNLAHTLTYESPSEYKLSEYKLKDGSKRRLDQDLKRAQNCLVADRPLLVEVLPILRNVTDHESADFYEYFLYILPAFDLSRVDKVSKKSMASLLLSNLALLQKKIFTNVYEMDLNELWIDHRITVYQLVRHVKHSNAPLTPADQKIIKSFHALAQKDNFEI
jgi:hypothetical protein